MKNLLFLFLFTFFCGCSNEKDFYKKNTEILEKEYFIKKIQYDNCQISYRGYNDKDGIVDSLEKILEGLLTVSSNEKKNDIIEQIENIFSHRRAEVDRDFFSEIKNCNYDDVEKISYYSSLIKLTFVNTQLVVFYKWKFSFDCTSVSYDLKIKGDSLEIFPMLLANNSYKPNFLLIGNDTLYYDCTYSSIKYKYSKGDSLLSKAELYSYSTIEEKYQSWPLSIKIK